MVIALPISGISYTKCYLVQLKFGLFFLSQGNSFKIPSLNLKAIF